jgi:hypothetical protein
MQRLRRGDDALAFPILAVPIERLLRRPAFEDQIEGFAQTAVAVVVAKPALAGEQRVGEARAEAKDEAVAADHVIGHRGLDRGIDRMGEMDEFYRRPHADALGQRGRLAHQQLRHRQSVDLADIDRLAVMLADIGVAIAELVGQHDLGEVLFVGLGGGGVGTKAVRENSEFHFQSSMTGGNLRSRPRLDNAWAVARVWRSRMDVLISKLI